MTRALDRAIATLAEARGQASRTHVDLRVSLRLCDVHEDEHGFAHWRPETDEELTAVGWRWNRRTKDWDDAPPESQVVIRVHRGQEKSARWLAEWLDRMAIGPKGAHWSEPMRHDPMAAVHSGDWRARSLLLLGGRRSGKSNLACDALVLSAVMVKGVTVWAVSPTQETADELEQAIRKLLPTSWYTFHGGGAGKELTFKLENGSRIKAKSAHNPSRLKCGGSFLVLLNEGQLMPEKAWVNVRGATSDHSGLVVIAANPPDEEIGRWIEGVHDHALTGENRVQMFQFDPEDNPFVDRSSLEDFAHDLDSETYDREVRGIMVPIGDVVFKSWSAANVLTSIPSEFVDITAEITRRVLGRAAGYVVGMDFQATPHMVAVVYKFFRDPAHPDEVISIVVDEVICPDSDENDLADALEELPRWQASGRRDADTYRGWIEESDKPAEPVHCAVVMDASGFWQDGEHTKGKTSDRALRGRRWAQLYRPQGLNAEGSQILDNPDVKERCKVARARVMNKAGARRLFALAHCKGVIEAMRSWPNKNRKPNSTSQYAHVCDGATYPLFRFFGVPKAKAPATGRSPRPAAHPSGRRGELAVI